MENKCKHENLPMPKYLGEEMGHWGEKYSKYSDVVCPDCGKRFTSHEYQIVPEHCEPKKA